MVVVELRAEATLHVSPYGFWRYGRLFLEARKKLRLTRGFSPVPYYLTCRAIELELKAFLLTRGVSKDYVKRTVRHDLKRALKDAEKRGLASVVRVTPERRAQVRLANRYYATKGFEYFDIMDAVRGYRDLPDLKVLDRFAASLVKQLRQVCLDAA